MHTQMQALPAACAQRLQHALGRGQRQGQQHQQRQGSHEDEGALQHILQRIVPQPAHVQPEVAQGMQCGIEKRKQPDQTAQPRQRRQPQRLAQRRDRQRQTQTAQCPIAAAADQRFSRIGPQPIGQQGHHHPGQRCQTQQPHHRFGGAVQQQWGPAGKGGAAHGQPSMSV